MARGQAEAFLERALGRVAVWRYVARFISGARIATHRAAGAKKKMIFFAKKVFFVVHFVKEMAFSGNFL